jgi:hypothetical protein
MMLFLQGVHIFQTNSLYVLLFSKPHFKDLSIGSTGNDTMTKNRIEIIVLKKMLGDHPLTLEERQRLGKGIFTLHGFITAQISAPNASPYQRPHDAHRISSAEIDAREQEAILALQEELQTSNKKSLAMPRKNPMITHAPLLDLICRLYHHIHLALAMDTCFLPWVEDQLLTPEVFWKNRLTAQQRLHLQVWCDGYR